MEDNNTQSKVEGEKPDFEKMLQKSAFKCHPLDIEPNAIMISKAEYLMDELWDTYVSPLHSRIKGLEQERDAALKERDEILERADARIKELESSQSWVSVKERYPEAGQLVFVHLSDGSRLTGRVWGNGSWSAFFVDGESTLTERRVTFWQPLPSKPENK